MIVRPIARPLLASIFVFGGAQALRAPGARAQKAEAISAHDNPLAHALHIKTGEQAVRANAAVQIGAGLALATGRLPRLSALLLAGSLLPTTAAGHAFWEETDPTTKAAQKTHFVKNLSLLGGLMIAAVDTEGKDSTARKTKRATKRAARRATVKATRAAAKAPIPG